MAERVLIIGRSGQLAHALAHAETRLDMVFRGRGDIELTRAGLARAIDTIKPLGIINAAGFTQVDAAERDELAALSLNRDAPHALALAAAEFDIPLIHISTDYVFDGAKGAPYTEEDAVSPLNAYGRSKAEGEARVIESGARAAILRTSWLYSLYGDNFLTRLMVQARTRARIDVVEDQFGTPTHCQDLARACLLCLDRLRAGDCEAEGVFHVANAGSASRADFAEAAMTEAAPRGMPHARVQRIPTRVAPGVARRPMDSRLDGARFARTFGWCPPPWRAALRACFAASA